MSDKNKKGLLDNVNLKVGKNKFPINDTDRLKATHKDVNVVDKTDNMPRNIQNHVNDVSGKINTSVQSSITSPASASKLPISNLNKSTSTENNTSTTQTSSEVTRKIENTVHASVGHVASLGIDRVSSNISSANKGHNKPSTSSSSSTGSASGNFNKTAYNPVSQAYKPSIVKTVGIEAKTTFLGELQKYKGCTVNLSLKSTFGQTSRDGVYKVQSSLAKQDDIGSQTLASGIGVGMASYNVARTTVDVSPTLAKGITKVSKGTYDVASTGVKATMTVANTGYLIGTGAIPLDKTSLSMLKAQASITGLNKTQLSQNIIKSVENTVKTATTIKNGAVKTYEVGKKTAHVSYDVATTLGKATITVSNTSNLIRHGIVPMNKEAINVLKQQAIMTGLNRTDLSKRIIRNVNQIHNKVNILADRVNTASKTINKTINSSVKIVRGVVNGKVPVKVSILMLNEFKGKTLKRINTAIDKGLKTGVEIAKKGTEKVIVTSVNGAIKGSMWTGFVGVPKFAKFSDNGIGGVGKILKGSDDMALQGVGSAVDMARIGVKTGVKAGKTTVHGIKTGSKTTVAVGKGTIKATKTAWNGLKYARQNGLRKAFKTGGRKVANGFINAGKSVIQLVINIIRSLGAKVVLPIILVVAIVMSISSIATTPVTIIASLFGGTFATTEDDITYTDYEVRDFVVDATYGVPYLRTQYINDTVAYLDNQLVSGGGSYHYTRFYTSEDSENFVEVNYANISSLMYTEEEIANIVQPIFQAVLVMDYDLSPSESEAKNALKTIFDEIFTTSEEHITEYCGQDEHTDPIPYHDCGEVHADVGTCPNIISGTHTSYTCDTCCYHYYTCNGHRTRTCGRSSHSHSSSCYDDEGHKTCGRSSHSHSESCYSYPKCNTGNMSSPCSNSTEHDACLGYNYCGGHEVLLYTLNMDGVYGLIQKYFTDPIDVLSNQATRTEEEEIELQNLKDYYELALEYISEVSLAYGGGLTMEDISGVVWVNGSRTPNQDLIDLALTQVGQTGGQPYWSWYGFDSRVEWCATFVSWCFYQEGYSAPREASCQYGMVPYFSNLGQWADGGFTDLVAGDVILFDWNLDGKANHVGLVIGTDGTNVYTVEGNSGDTCRVKSYSLNSSVIMGYGLMNY